MSTEISKRTPKEVDPAVDPPIENPPDTIVKPSHEKSDADTADLESLGSMMDSDHNPTAYADGTAHSIASSLQTYSQSMVAAAEGYGGMVTSAFNYNYNTGGECTVEDFDEMCKMLRENDPSLTTVKVGDSSLDQMKTFEFGSSLKENTVVQKVIVDFTNFCKNRGSMDDFVEYLSKSPSLRTVAMFNVIPTQKDICAYLALVLGAISRNPNIKTVSCDSVPKVKLQGIRAMKQNIMEEVSVWRTPDPKQSVAVAFSLSCCKTVENLELERMPEDFLCQLLPDLCKISSLTSLAMGPKVYTTDTFVALSALLTKTDSLRHLELRGYGFTHTRFEPVEVGMSNNISVRAVTLLDCWFNYGATGLFQDMFTRRGTKLAMLTVGKNVSFHQSIGKTVSTILEHEDSQLTDVDLRECELGNRDLIDMFKSLGDYAEQDESEVDGMQGTRKCLERLHLGTITETTGVEAVQETIPKLFGLKYISLKLGPKTEGQKEELIDAFKCNATLEHCSIGKEEVILKQKKPKRKDKKIKDKTIDRSEQLKRRESLRSILSEEEIELINAKDEYLQMDANNASSNSLIPEEETKGKHSDNATAADEEEEATEQGDETIEEALDRHHGVGENVRKLLTS